jgi:hypothetical protein
LQEIIKQGRVDNKTKVGKQTVAQYVDSNKGVLETRYGQTKLTGDVDKALGGDKAMRSNAEKLKLAKQTGNADQIAAAQTALDESSASFFSERGKADISKMNVNGVLGEDAFKDNPELARAQLKAIAEKQAQLLPSVLAKASGKTIWGTVGANGKSRGGIVGHYNDILEKAVAAEMSSGALKQDQGDIAARFAAQVNQATTNPAAVPAIATEQATIQTRFKAEMDKVKVDLDNVRLSGIGDLPAAQKEYNTKITALQDQQKQEEQRVISNYTGSLMEQQAQEEDELIKAYRKKAGDRLGKERFDRVLANNMFGTAPEEKATAEEKSAESKPAAKT